MKSNLLYVNRGGTEATELSTRGVQLLSRRSFVRRSSLFLPLAFFAGSAVKSAANSTIISRTISAANQNAISMSNSTWARPVTFPTGWQTIRIGMRMHMTNTGASLTSNPIFAMGLCSGTTNQYGDATTTHFVGCAFDRATFTFSGGNYLVPMPIARKRIGTTNTDSAALAPGANSDFNGGAATATADRAIYFLDIIKGSPNYTFHLPFFIDNSVGVGGDISAANFLAFMALSTPNPGGNYQTLGQTDQTLAVNEVGDGTLNALNMYWNRVDATLEICDIAVAVLA